MAWPGASGLTPTVAATEATGVASTTSGASPVTPSAVARMITLPVATPVTTPLDDTVAMVGSSELHLTAWPGNGAPNSSSGTADADVVCPTTIDDAASDTAMLATVCVVGALGVVSSVAGATETADSHADTTQMASSMTHVGRDGDIRILKHWV